MDTFDTFASVLDDVTLNAMRTWWDEYAAEQVTPSMVAAADDAFVLSLEAILSVTAQWESVYESDVEPVVKALAAVRAAETLADSNIIDLSALTPDQTAQLARRLEGMRDALKLIKDRGIDISKVEYVVALPNWDNYIDEYAMTRRNLVVGMPETVYRDLVTQLATASRNGVDTWERSKLVREFLSWEGEGGYDQWMTRAQRISRTETNGLLNSADLHAWKTEAAADIDDGGEGEMHKVWLCVAPDTVVGSSHANLAARRRYEGTMIRITTASGRSLSLTPEHPVLTGRGWIIAGDLDLTDNLFQIVGAETTGAPDVQDAPPGIGEVVDAAIDLAPAKVRALPAGVDFNGHPVAGDVEVVPVDGKLSLDLEAAVTEDVRDLHLTDADVLAHGLMFSDSSAGDDLAGDSATSHLLPSQGVPGSLSGGIFPGSAKDTGGGLVPDRDALLAKKPDHHVVTSGQPCGNCGCGQPVHISTRYVPSVDVSASTSLNRKQLGGTSLLDGGGVTLEAETSSLTPLADGHPARPEPARHGGGVGADGAGNLAERMSGLVESDDLVDIERYTFVGHVYDLSTAAQWYEANGLVVHNCTLDTRTRDTHFAADGQRVPLEGKFNLGGYEIDHPGDQSLPAHEAIGCRCTMMRVRADEEVPDDTDRQTERERIHQGRDVPARDPQAEVRSRARRGVTRDGDNDDDHPLIASGDDTMTRTQWSGILAPINKPTGDGRIFDSDAELSFREFPLPLMFQRATGNGHDTAVVVGKISDATIESDGVHATGEFFDNDDAREAAELVAEGVMRPSVDLTDMIVEHELLDDDGNPIDIDNDDIDFDDIAGEVMHVRAATIMAATLVSKPAFAEAKIILGEQTAAPADDEREQEQEALLASAATLVETVDRTMFADPQLDSPTALTMTDDGRVYGHLALWSTEHIARPGVTPPRSRTDYAMFHTSSVATDDGSLAVGRLTVGTGHADARANSRATAAHYDNTGTTWALVRAGEDQHGIWVSGIVDPGATEAQVREGLSAPLSGDWRNVGGNLELVAALSVNTPGFPVPRSYAINNDREMSLVASGVVRRASRSDQLADAVAEGLRRHDERRAQLAAQRERADAARTMAAQILAREVAQ